MSDIQVYYENETLHFSGVVATNYAIIDISGRIMQTFENVEQNTFIAFSGKPGIYILKYMSQGIYKTTKFVIK